MRTAQNKSVTVLAAMRQQLGDSFNSRTTDNDTIDPPEFERINSVEAKIARATFKTRADKRAGSRILMEDKPGYWCEFQVRLFMRIAQFV